MKLFLSDFKQQLVNFIAEFIHGSLEPYQKVKGNDYRKAYGTDSR